MVFMSAVERNGNDKRSLDYISDKCVGCGICTSICPTESLRLGPVLPIARGLVDMDYVSINKNSCVLCGLCASACPFEAFQFKINDENIKDLDAYPQWKHSASIDNEECLYCKACETACPQDAITIKRELPKRSNLVIGEIDINKDDCIYCGICEEMCPPQAITITRDRPLDRDIKVDEDKCVYCLVCKRACPVDAIKAACASCSYGEYDLNPEDAKITGRAILQEDSCVNCGWCQEICPVDAAHVVKPFEGEISVNIEECKGESCHACVDVCPCNAASIVDDKSSIEGKFCILCGACSNVCPQKCITIKRDKMNLENIRSKSWQNKLSGLMAGK
jgi:4Fe-4S ferredoxin